MDARTVAEVREWLQGEALKEDSQAVEEVKRLLHPIGFPGKTAREILLRLAEILPEDH